MSYPTCVGRVGFVQTGSVVGGDVHPRLNARLFSLSSVGRLGHVFQELRSQHALLEIVTIVGYPLGAIPLVMLDASDQYVTFLVVVAEQPASQQGVEHRLRDFK